MSAAHDVEALLAQLGSKVHLAERRRAGAPARPGVARARALLPDGGLPRGVVELAAPRALGGATSVALAAVRAGQARGQERVVRVDRSRRVRLHAPGVVAAGVDLARMLVVRSTARLSSARVAREGRRVGAFEVVWSSRRRERRSRGGEGWAPRCSCASSRWRPSRRGRRCSCSRIRRARAPAPWPVSLRLELSRPDAAHARPCASRRTAAVASVPRRTAPVPPRPAPRRLTRAPRRLHRPAGDPRGDRAGEGREPPGPASWRSLLSPSSSRAGRRGEDRARRAGQHAARRGVARGARARGSAPGRRWRRRGRSMPSCACASWPRTRCEGALARVAEVALAFGPACGVRRGARRRLGRSRRVRAPARRGGDARAGARGARDASSGTRAAWRWRTGRASRRRSRASRRARRGGARRRAAGAGSGGDARAAHRGPRARRRRGAVAARTSGCRAAAICRSCRGARSARASGARAHDVMQLLDGEDRAPLDAWRPPEVPEERVELEWGAARSRRWPSCSRRCATGSRRGCRVARWPRRGSSCVLRLDRALCGGRRSPSNTLGVVLPVPLARAADLLAVVRARLERHTLAAPGARGDAARPRARARPGPDAGPARAGAQGRPRAPAPRGRALGRARARRASASSRSSTHGRPTSARASSRTAHRRPRRVIR